jgi:hypothetical protein
MPEQTGWTFVLNASSSHFFGQIYLNQLGFSFSEFIFEEILFQPFDAFLGTSILFVLLEEGFDLLGFNMSKKLMEEGRSRSDEFQQLSPVGLESLGLNTQLTFFILDSFAHLKLCKRIMFQIYREC